MKKSWILPGVMLDGMKKQNSTRRSRPSREPRKNDLETAGSSSPSTSNEVELTKTFGLDLARLNKSLRRIVDRRKERRDAVAQPVWVRWSEDPETIQKGHLVDVSDHGMKLSLGDPIPAGAAISVVSQDCIVRAKVTYCVCHSDSEGHGQWHIGIYIVHRPWEMVEPPLSRTDKNKFRGRITEDTAGVMNETNRLCGDLVEDSPALVRKKNRSSDEDPRSGFAPFFQSASASGYPKKG